METTHNGWSNYPTWRVNLEVWDGYETDHEMTGEEIEEQTMELINPTGERTLAVDYAEAFLSDVNWEEIAEHVND